VDKARLQDRLEDVDERVVDDAVAEIAHADRSCFWVTQDEFTQRFWSVCSRSEFSRERCEVQLPFFLELDDSWVS